MQGLSLVLLIFRLKKGGRKNIESESQTNKYVCKDNAGLNISYTTVIITLSIMKVEMKGVNAKQFHLLLYLFFHRVFNVESLKSPPLDRQKDSGL